MPRTTDVLFRDLRRLAEIPGTKARLALAIILHLLAEGPTGALTFLETQFGKPFTANGFGNWFRRRCNEADLPHCSAHGLRKAGATIAADNGATAHQLTAIFGWTTIKQAEIYEEGRSEAPACA